MKKFQRIAAYLFSFGIARGILFVSPILLANLLPSHVYGTLEWSYAAASVIATLVAVGTNAAIPLVELKKVQLGSFSGILVHQVALASICVVLIVTAWLVGASEVFVMTTLLVAAVALQVLWSTYLKTHGRGEASLFVDAGVFALMSAAVIAARFFNSNDASSWVIWGIIGYVGCLFAVSLVGMLRRLHEGEAIAYRAVLALGVPLMIASLVTIAATTSGRLMVGYLGGAVLTADYAVLARVAAIPIIAHQVVMVAKFRHLFTLPDREMERAVAVIIALVSLAVVIFSLSFDRFGWFFGPAFVKAFGENSLPAMWVLGQSILWSGIALHDLINTRYQTMRHVLPWSIGFLLASIPVAIVIIKFVGVSLAHFVFIHGILMLLFYLNQIQVMYRAGIRLVRAWSIAVGGYVLFVVAASLCNW